MVHETLLTVVVKFSHFYNCRLYSKGPWRCWTRSPNSSH